MKYDRFYAGCYEIGKARRKARLELLLCILNVALAFMVLVVTI